MAALLDINVLVALAWPNHEHHARAHVCFAAQAAQGWATCPLTQSGFVRLSSNPKIIPHAVKPIEAVGLLQRMTAHPNHQFWEDDIRLDDAAYVPWQNIIGHRQITDAYLLGLSLKRGGRLATLDQGIASLARSPKEREAVEIIEG